LDYPLSIENRKIVLQQDINIWLQRGFYVIHKDDFSATLRKPKEFSFVFALFWFLFFGIGLIIYILYYISKKDTIKTITVDEWFGYIDPQKEIQQKNIPQKNIKREIHVISSEGQPLKQPIKDHSKEIL
jgi:hypothetical protein